MCARMLCVCVRVSLSGMVAMCGVYCLSAIATQLSPLRPSKVKGAARTGKDENVHVRLAQVVHTSHN